MTTFNNFPDQVYAATMTGSNGIVVTGSLSPNKITVTLDSNAFLVNNSDVKIIGSASVNGLLVSSSNDYGYIEIGGPNGGYIDLKKPFSDDYDLRLYSFDTPGAGGIIENYNSQTTIVLSGTNIGINSLAPKARLEIKDITADGGVSPMQKWAWFNDENWQLRLDQIYPLSQNRIDYGLRIRNGDTTDIEALYFKSDGKVGVGTTAPISKLQVSGTIRSNSGVQYDGLIVSNGAGASTAAIYGLSSNNDDGIMFLSSGGIPKVAFNSIGVSYILGGNFGIGTSIPGYQLQLSTDSAAKPSTNTWTIASDSRIKENVLPYTKGLETVLQINPSTYDYNGKAGFQKIKNNVGVIAQDVLQILPECISTYKAKLNEEDTEETELYNFNSHALTYIMLNSIKQLKAENDGLKEQLNDLRSRLSALENK